MKLTNDVQVSVDGVVQGNGGLDPAARRGGFERRGWARPLFDSEAMTFVDQFYQRADAFLFGRRTYELFAGRHAAVPDTGPDIALDVVESRAFPKGIRLQVYRPTGRPQYAT